jgi:LacI family transcriptional regulator
MTTPARRATMRDVAKRAGVSLATVAYVLNPGTRPVSATRRGQVMAAIEALGYEPAPRPRLRTSALAIGLVVPDATNMFFARTVAGVEGVLGRAGHVLLGSSSGDDPAREREVIASLVKRRIDAGRAAGGEGAEGGGHGPGRADPPQPGHDEQLRERVPGDPAPDRERP